MIELLSPVGDFECLKAAVQNGADAVYFGSNLFSARAYATNFDNTNLEDAINYAKLRGVKTHLTVNTLIKDHEFEEAINLVKKAYEFGIDAIIVQDLGLACKLIKLFPDLNIHASTQMTTTNLDGVKSLEKIGFKRIVLARECSLSEIKDICDNSNIEIEVFSHGALCICYSGQCLFSSMIGGRSGNRGECAQPCRLPYSVLSNEKISGSGYILSPRDLCTLENLPKLIKTGITSLKIEGRMKSPIYVSTVTRIYRKYIDLAIKFNNKEINTYIVSQQDRLDLLQVFNRGNFSSGHLLDEPNKKLIFKEKPNNIGIYLGKIEKYNKNKGLITAKLENKLSIGDGISLENENTKYLVSELLKENQNIKTADKPDLVTFGRMKGNIKIKDNIYKITDKNLTNLSLNSYRKENIKNPLYCKLDIYSNKHIKITVKSLNYGVESKFSYDFIPQIADNAPLTIEKIKKQFNKTLDTPFEFLKFEINMADNVFIPTSILNDIRRQTIKNIEQQIIKSYKKISKYEINNTPNFNFKTYTTKKTLLLNTLNTKYDYSKIEAVYRIYLPLRYFIDEKYFYIIKALSKVSNIYIYIPTVIKNRYINKIHDAINYAITKHNISGFLVSELSSLEFLKQFNLDIIANYNLNVYNYFTANKLKDLGFSTITLSPELTKEELENIDFAEKEVIVYGKIPLMTTSYCLLGESNRCYKDCKHLCLNEKEYYIKDRYNFKFRVIPDNIQTLNTIYNSKNISLGTVNCMYNRYDILDETIDEINFTIA